MPSILFPDPPRELPGQRLIKISLRAVHVLCVGVLTATYLLDLGTNPQRLAEARETWLAATVATGSTILALDLYQSGAFLLQVRGAVLFLKLGCLLFLARMGDAAGYVLAALVLVSVISSHAPSRWRYRVLVGGGRVRGADTPG
ncbi:MAG: hypothetical protein H6831_00795 [Planctomycetes bacterium]|nr:hypothetical protein [Planctomycetota bacterium]